MRGKEPLLSLLTDEINLTQWDLSAKETIGIFA